MSNIFVQNRVIQGTTLGTVPIKLFVVGHVYQGTSPACIVDITPPTFAGITGLVSGSLGQIRAVWGVATDPTPPIRYEVYILAGTSVGLYNTSNIISITDKLQYDIFTLPNGQLLQNGVTYYVGVRAIDGANNRDNNLVSMSLVSVGVSDATNNYTIDGVFSLNEDNQLTASFWTSVDEELITSSIRLGTASYVIYDRNGNTVIGLTESGIVADSNGLFEITPVNSTLALDLNYYTVKVTVIIDSAPRTNYLPIVGKRPSYESKGQFSINALNQFQATLWAVTDDIVKTTNLGTASYAVYDASGALVSGLSQSGITADVNGRFQITPVSASVLSDLTHYSVKIAIEIDGVERISYKGFTLLGA